MKPTNLVTCPNCKTQFSIESALTADLEKEIDAKLRKELNDKFILEKKKLEEAAKLKEEQIAIERKQFMEEQQKELYEKRKEMEELIKQKLTKEHEDMMEALRKNSEEQEEKLKAFKRMEVEKMEMEKRMKEMADQFELETKKKLIEREIELKEKLSKEAEQKNELIVKELQKQLEDQKKLAEEMRRKAEQGSMQMQGEVQELAIEDMLKQTFPFDRISEVGKGVRGADLIQTVVNNLGMDCGTIVWESKRTKEFQPLWIEKFKADFRQSGGDIGVIVTQAMPKDMEGFGLKDGIYICQYHEAKSLALILRMSLIRISEAASANENKGEKMQMLYSYLTGNEFKHQIEAITEGFMSMKKAIISERNAMEKIWKEREKQIDKVLLNAVGMYGSIKGIAGSAVSEIKALDLGHDETLNEA
ncbi:MAG: DUF2130 domain-containing protein [Bacteroidetes bacterium]|nr:DUF2130 domain-containing protein [Bacteroidota bacterium]